LNLTLIVVLVLALYVIQLFLQEVSLYGFSPKLILGNRDKKPELSVTAARFDRAKNNMMEALPLFLGLSLLAIARGVETRMVINAAWVFFGARVAYVPVYAAGITVLRSAIWVLSMAALLVMALALFP